MGSCVWQWSGGPCWGLVLARRTELEAEPRCQADSNPPSRSSRVVLPSPPPVPPARSHFIPGLCWHQFLGASVFLKRPFVPNSSGQRHSPAHLPASGLIGVGGVSILGVLGASL